MRLAVVQGTRPEIAKNYSIVQALEGTGTPYEVFHTGQHSRQDMCDEVYRDMGYEPSRVFPGSYRLGRVIDWLQDCFRRDGITAVIVNGDTAAALVGAIAALYIDLPVAHVEAGLRSGDPLMLEERNRMMVDEIAHHLFAYTSYEVDVLARNENIRGTVHLAGNTTVDLLHDFAHRIGPPDDTSPYVFVTLHRKEFTDVPDRMTQVFGALASLAEGPRRVVFAMHPRTADAMSQHGIARDVLGDVEVRPPVGVFESLSLQRYADVVLTDSGCVQEEAYLLATPCVTIRENTERHLTVSNGANVLTGFSPDLIVGAAQAAAQTGRGSWPPIYGTPGTGARIVDVMSAADGTRPAQAVRSEQSVAVP
ncbi:UDP-N-acetyl glucosamine 2-epimerase [Nocardioides mangrovi]|uniref:UDP-N-acetyl glucosamine 2-epimerase n=1 Tax=Nocardioides mangrovi TaxID=2874580 RepID=A0ABS7U831_9ACTN|nr:UDP-N-acetylglucosamine 2-epimerase [Nocardioides mangrovi]MBZ5736896.1 UDP-N-acetyl glucosamine 2-epimerase [Nocardioides mangrovi]